MAFFDDSNFDVATYGHRGWSSSASEVPVQRRKKMGIIPEASRESGSYAMPGSFCEDWTSSDRPYAGNPQRQSQKSSGYGTWGSGQSFRAPTTSQVAPASTPRTAAAHSPASTPIVAEETRATRPIAAEANQASTPTPAEFRAFSTATSPRGPPHTSERGASGGACAVSRASGGLGRAPANRQHLQSKSGDKSGDPQHDRSYS